MTRRYDPGIQCGSKNHEHLFEMFFDTGNSWWFDEMIWDDWEMVSGIVLHTSYRIWLGYLVTVIRILMSYYWWSLSLLGWTFNIPGTAKQWSESSLSRAKLLLLQLLPRAKLAVAGSRWITANVALVHCKNLEFWDTHKSMCIYIYILYMIYI